MKKLTILFFLCFFASLAQGQNTVPDTLFGAGWNDIAPTGNPPQPNPWCPQDSAGTVASLTSFRLWDDGVKWSQVETSASSPTDRTGYVFTKMDYAIRTLATTAGCPMKILYQFGSTPKFAGACSTAADPSTCLPGPTPSFGGGTQCASPSDYSCLPPMDVNGDGTGADAWFMNYAAQVLGRYKGQIAQYGLWNEADSKNFWCWQVAACGTGGNPVTTPNVSSLKNLVLMNWDFHQLAACIDPAAQIISPDGHVGTMPTWFHNYVITSITAPARSFTVTFIAGGVLTGSKTCTWGSQTVTGKDTFDIVDEHMRGGNSNSDPTQVIAAYNAAKTEMTTDGLLGRPLFNDEWGYKQGEVPNVATAAAFVGVNLALQASFSSPSIQQENFYLWDNNNFPLSKTIGGLAHDVIAQWLTGATVNPFSQAGNIYSITGSGATLAQAGAAFKITFDGSKTCSGSTISTCATANQSAGTFTHYTTLDGVTHLVSGGVVPVGLAPILLTGATSANAPTCTPTGGAFNTSQSVTCSSSSGGAVLCYNFTGAPATNGGAGCAAGSTLYAGAFSINLNETLFVVAGGTGFTDSTITNYVFSFQGDAPTFSPVAGSYVSTQSVTISQAQSLGICYTTDNSTPTSNGSGVCSHGTAYSGPISVAVSETLKAIGMQTGYTDSTVGTSSYVINAATQAAAPTCSPAGGTFATVQNPTCSTTSAGAVQCWTLDGSTPITNGASACTHGTLYSGAIPVTVNSTLMIVAGGTSYLDSLVTSYAFSFHGSAPTFSPIAGTYSTPQTVTLTDPQSLSMCYTTNGTTPTSNGLGSACTNGTLYSTPISVSSSLTLKAVGIKNGWNDSGGGTAAYTISGGVTAATPTFSPNGGAFSSSQSVTIATTSVGAILCYTTDGSTPITNGTTGCSHGTLYSGALTVNASETIMAIAGGSGFTDSAVATAAFTFQGATPTFSPAAGTYNGAQTITISNTSSLSMCYTTDGTAPTSNGSGACSNGTLYSVPLVLAATTTLKAISMHSGYTDSAVGTAAYTINYGMTVSVVGLGTVNSSPVGINACSATGGICTSSFNQGTVVTLTAAPNSGYSFAGWSGGGCAGTGTCVVTMNSATSVTATFSLIVPQVSAGQLNGLLF